MWFRLYLWFFALPIRPIIFIINGLLLALFHFHAKSLCLYFLFKLSRGFSDCLDCTILRFYLFQTFFLFYFFSILLFLISIAFSRRILYFINLLQLLFGDWRSLIFSDTILWGILQQIMRTK